MILILSLQGVLLFLIIPQIRSINEILKRCLFILSRVTKDEALDEIRKLTLCKHLLEGNDENWITQNQIKLVFYNRSKEFQLNKPKVNQKKKENYFYSFRLADQKMPMAKDVVLYLLVSLFSMGYLFSAFFVQDNQIQLFDPLIQMYSDGLVT